MAITIPQTLGSFQVLSIVGKMDADGNETSGVASVPHQVPVSTYTGWNTVARGFYKGHVRVNTGSFIPCAKTKAERIAAGGPRCRCLKSATALAKSMSTWYVLPPNAWCAYASFCRATPAGLCLP